jgi:hypothetical protein
MPTTTDSRAKLPEACSCNTPCPYYTGENPDHGDREDVALGTNSCSGFWNHTFSLGRAYPGVGRHSDSNSHQLPLFRLVSSDMN